MSDYSELKRLAEAVNERYWPCDINDARLGLVVADYMKALSPAAVMELIAENESQRKDLQNLRTDNAQLLYALKQEEQSYLVLRAERDQLKAENEALRKDAERLDWLTAQGEIEEPGQGDVRGFIDKAMSKDTPHG